MQEGHSQVRITVAGDSLSPPKAFTWLHMKQLSGPATIITTLKYAALKLSLAVGGKQF
jgi:hypothetical protein